MTYTNSLKFAWDQTSDSFNWPKGSEGFCLTGILHLLASCDRIAASEEMGAGFPPTAPQIRHNETLRRLLVYQFWTRLLPPHSQPQSGSAFLFSDKRPSSIYIFTFIQNLVRLTAHHIKNIRISTILSSESGFPLQVREPTCSNKMSPPVLYQHKYAFQIFAYVRHTGSRSNSL